MNFNKKQKVVKSNTESQETTKFSNNESIETQSDNEESKSDTSENPSQNFKSIPDGYRPLSKTSASKLGSKVWNYFQPLEHIATGNRVGWCPLEVIRNHQKQTCNTICNTGGSTENMWDHLSSIHAQTKQNQSLVEWIIDSVQALRVDPYYELPTHKAIKSMIHTAYNFSSNILKQKLKNTAISYSLTCDLWTSRNHKAYLGQRIFIMTIKIMDNWDISNKVNTITIDNTQNMVKALKLMEAQGISRVKCIAHTLQLVVGKGLIPAKILIAYTKRLLAFFMSPKQLERLEDA
ncbi:3418_t:CDS:2 [Cetraspora pellucida]|uniref:3418_t:CDS:1 n=1 Tax=Cetraspora pellucida TaxID=1433469 RepID=A0ACA9LTQ3_9GLOM|nr:3418_t:CDS:2 [Cetraspora pellucida]